MRNVTVSLNEDLVRRARVEAAKRDMSLSKFVASVLEEKLCSEDEFYERAMKEFLAEEPFIIRKQGERWPTRDEHYERPRLR